LRRLTGRRRALVLAYFFPPLGGAGVQRTLKFVEHLAPLGWDATVVSTRSRVYGARDPSLLAEIPAETRVVRTAALPLARYLGILLYRLRLRRLRAWVVWPDGGLGWTPFALAAALRLARRERPDVLVSTSAPYGAHLVGLLVARLTGMPWVADFRDEWSANPGLRDQPKALNALAGRAERAIARLAARVVVAADYFHLEGLPADSPRRLEILNGVDEADLEGVGPGSATQGRFVLAHVGSIYGDQDPTPVLEALARLAGRRAVDGDRLEVRLVGSIWDERFAPPPGVRVESLGYVPHREAVAEMVRATAVLLWVSSSSLAPSGKLFEYLASGRPLLCVTRSDNLAARLVREWDAGVVADPDDGRAIEQAILTLWERWKADGLPDQMEVRARTLEHYSRRAAAERLAGVLDEACRD
jgi:glycosyltransferase involved in cell wall biosynthesis